MEAAPKERLGQSLFRISLESLFRISLGSLFRIPLGRLFRISQESLFRRTTIPKALKRKLVLDEVQLHLLWFDSMFKPFKQSR